MPTKNLGLDRPRTEKPYDKSTCVSVGVDHMGTAKSSNDRMDFGSKHASELWGKKR